MHWKELSVIIVNYNGICFLKDCLDSLQEKLKSISSEIIILDNDSQDESCSFIKKNYPNVKLIESKVNYGFGKGNNEAVKHAVGKYILLFNNDTILLNDIYPAIQLLKRDKSIGVIGINMLSGNREYLQAAGEFPNSRNLFWMKRAFLFNKDFISGNFTKDIYEVDWLTGSFLLLSKEVYDNIGGFDESYFMYVEDVDFCKKIANLGLKRIFISSLSYIHFVGFKKSKNPMLVAGYKIYLKKHFKGLSYFIALLSLEINVIVKKIKAIF